MSGLVFFLIIVLACLLLFSRLKIANRKIGELERKLEDRIKANHLQLKVNSVLSYDIKRLTEKKRLVIEDVQKREQELLAKAHEIELDKIDHEAMVERFKAESEMMRDYVEELRTREDELLEQIEQFRKSIKQLEKENQSLERDISDFQDYAMKIEKVVSNLQSHNSRLKMRLSVLNVEDAPLPQQGALLELDKTFNFKYPSRPKKKSKEPWIELDSN